MKRGRAPRRRKALKASSVATIREWRQAGARKWRSKPKADPGFQREARLLTCAVCGRGMKPGGEYARTHGHHVLAQEFIRLRARWERWPEARLVEVLSDRRNRLVLCETCHADHEHGNAQLRREHVPAAAWVFARELGRWAVVRLERDYQP